MQNLIKVNEFKTELFDLKNILKNEITGEVWFQLKEICDNLEIKNSRKVKNRIECGQTLEFNSVTLSDGNKKGNPRRSSIIFTYLTSFSS